MAAWIGGEFGGEWIKNKKFNKNANKMSDLGAYMTHENLKTWKSREPQPFDLKVYGHG